MPFAFDLMIATVSFIPECIVSVVTLPTWHSTLLSPQLPSACTSYIAMATVAIESIRHLGCHLSNRCKMSLTLAGEVEKRGVPLYTMT